MALSAAVISQNYDSAITLIYRQLIDQYFNVASVAYWLYDYFLTIIPEITLIWLSPWTPIKLLYFLTRYSPLVDSGLAIPIFVMRQATVGMCTNLYVAHTIFLYVGIVLAEVMLVYRVWVVWKRDKRIGIALFLFSLISIGAATGLTFALIDSFQIAPPYPPLGCSIIANIGSLQTASLSFILGYAFVLTLLMVIQYIRTCREGPYAGPFVRGTQLDGLVPYLFLLLISLCSVLTTIFAAPQGYGAIMLRFQRITHSVVACRVILQTKARFRKRQRSVLGLHT